MENIILLSDKAIERKIGEKIRFLRLRRNMTQMQLADSTQLSISTVKNLEKGEIKSFDAIIRVLRILCKLDIFTPLVEEEPLSPNEYYEMSLLKTKHQRKRASRTPRK